MRLDIRHWELLKAIHESGTLHKAADQLGITQSALSHRLAEAERRLGSAIYEREGRRLRLLPAAEQLTRTALELLPALQRAESDFMQYSRDATTVVRFGVAAYSCYHWLPGFMRWLEKQAPGLQLELVASATQHPVRSLQDGSVDLVMAPGDLSAASIDSTPLFDDELVLVVPPDHPLATRSWIKAEDLLQQTYLTYSGSAQPGFEYERFIRPSGIIPLQVKVVEMTDAIVELIAAGFGVSILSRWAVSAALETNRVAVVQVSSQGLDLGWSSLARESGKEVSAAGVLRNHLERWFQDSHPATTTKA
ncbi:LysR family transcriptional regulator [Marinobacterium jannaschii]|uniref:LysR family transcriptional regulator n=1 Tax=Marinobacterium jannaschii TaxID=64970 RepID=UPI0006854062|nr:LysR substrate-binding domain-containing protein [Marinobacterium jannaschii]